MTSPVPGYLSSLWAKVEEQLRSGTPPGATPPGPGPSYAENGEPPVIWLLGKAGAGKTSIVAALTGDEAAQIGDGFCPATRTARIYDVPEGTPVLRFLDTRGLGEAGYDPAEDMALYEAAAHVLVCVARVGDPAQGPVIEAARAVRRRHPDWPVVVVQTALHDLYPTGSDHPPSYPYQGDDADLRHHAVPASLAAALGAQRLAFAQLGSGPPPVFVPVDITRSEDRFSPPDFGADPLAQALAKAGVLVAEDLRRAARMGPVSRKARIMVLRFATSAGVAGAVPGPIFGALGLATVLSTMLGALARHYGVILTPALFRKLIGSIGGGATLYLLGARFLVGEALKAVPVIGQVPGAILNGVGAFALAYALGEAASAYLYYLARGQTPPDGAVERTFTDALKVGMRRARQARRKSGGAERTA